MMAKKPACYVPNTQLFMVPLDSLMIQLLIHLWLHPTLQPQMLDWAPGEADALPSRCLLSQHVMDLCEFCVCCHFHETLRVLFICLVTALFGNGPVGLGLYGAGSACLGHCGAAHKGLDPKGGWGLLQVSGDAGESFTEEEMGSLKVLSWLMTLLWL